MRCSTAWAPAHCLYNDLALLTIWPSAARWRNPVRLSATPSALESAIGCWFGLHSWTSGSPPLAPTIACSSTVHNDALASELGPSGRALTATAPACGSIRQFLLTIALQCGPISATSRISTHLSLLSLLAVVESHLVTHWVFEDSINILSLSFQNPSASFDIHVTLHLTGHSQIGRYSSSFHASSPTSEDWPDDPAPCWR